MAPPPVAVSFAGRTAFRWLESHVPQLPARKMTRKKATDRVVFAAADDLLAEGHQPIITAGRERTLGSYATVQEALGRWSRSQTNWPPKRTDS